MLRYGLFALFCSLLALQHLQHVRGDAALVAKVCHKTPEPHYCKLCFRSNRARHAENVKWLGAESIACSYIQSLYVNRDFDGFLKNSTDPKFKETCVVCKTYILAAVLNLGKALQTFIDGNYEESSNIVGGALDDYQRCARVIKTTEIPPRFRMNFQKLKGFYKVARAVLLQI